jgi:hypothetical protein
LEYSAGAFGRHRLNGIVNHCIGLVVGDKIGILRRTGGIFVIRKQLISLALTCVFFLVASSHASAAANSINLSDPTWLGTLDLKQGQLKKIKKAVEKAFKAPIDAEQQCGEVRLDCVVRAAREWKVDGNTYREIVIHIHTVGHASHAVGAEGGKWPKVVTK